MVYTHLAAAIVGAAIAAVGAWQVQGWRYGEQIASINTKHAQQSEAAAKSALRMTEHYRENADAAVRKAEERLAQNKRDADRLRGELDGLRGDLASVPERITSATREAVNQYATAATVVFDQCVRRYSDVAQAATGHAADVKTLMEAWPKD